MDINPKNILMIKGHSAGIGDILRSSASWRALKNRYPDAKLNLLFLTNHPNYPSEKLISKHHLLDSFYTINKQYFNEVKNFIKALKEADKVIKQVNPDFIIDFEPYGLETTIVSMIGRFKYGIKTIGINEVFPRGLLYSFYAPSIKSFKKKHKIDILNYTDRDFVVLDKLGIKRNDIQIEIKETPQATTFREKIKKELNLDDNVLIVNIGCGTPDAIPKRPDFKIYQEIIYYVYSKYGLTPVLIGAEFEKEVNQNFIKEYLKNYNHPIYDIAGRTDILESVGAINLGKMVISSDSGPYHIAVALGKPTLALTHPNIFTTTLGLFVEL
ncbi:glycosyltransferase family 9 protein [Sulfurihydrogenibium sp.]|uniref:glycosyltransferase family 9 protein n=1 Tax=Sulfurihydrogenibium sp. TaxID=2053621 RepID=UPI00262AFBF7|nr:glycosyltransferase family 9 protein [Sulfurihydrogenibium sp.]